MTGVQNAVVQLGQDLVNPDKIRDKLFQWLSGGTNLSGLTFDFSSVAGITNFLTQYAGLTWDHIKQVVMQQLVRATVWRPAPWRRYSVASTRRRTSARRKSSVFCKTCPIFPGTRWDNSC